MDSLIAAMQRTDSEFDIEIGRTAVESLSILIQTLGPAEQQNNQALVDALLQTSNVQRIRNSNPKWISYVVQLVLH